MPCEGSWSTKPDAIGWENLILPPDDTQPRQPPEEDQARVAALQVQKNALMACRDFLAKSDGSSSSDEDMNNVEMDKRGSLALNFFLMLFTRNNDLRNYYERNCSKGEFVCWVCWGIDKETRKGFGDCLGLVQHSKSINSAKRKWAHVAFAKAVCQVLGWNVDGSPSMALPPEESQAQNPEKFAKTQVEFYVYVVLKRLDYLLSMLSVLLEFSGIIFFFSSLSSLFISFPSNRICSEALLNRR